MKMLEARKLKPGDRVRVHGEPGTVGERGCYLHPDHCCYYVDVDMDPGAWRMSGGWLPVNVERLT